MKITKEQSTYGEFIGTVTKGETSIQVTAPTEKERDILLKHIKGVFRGKDNTSVKIVTSLTDDRYYTAIIENGFYFGKTIRGKYVESLKKIFVQEGEDEGFSIGVENVRIIG